MFCSKYSKNQPKPAARQKFAGGGKVTEFDKHSQRISNDISGADDLPITVRNRDGSINSKEGARIHTSGFLDALRERTDKRSGRSDSVRSRAKKKKSDD